MLGKSTQPSSPSPGKYLSGLFPLYLAVFMMRFSFAFTVVAIQFFSLPTPLDRGIIASAYPVMEMISGLFIGLLIDKIGKKWIIVNALFISSLVTLSFSFTNSPVLLTIIHGFQGICAAAIVTGTLALLTDIGLFRTRGRQMGFYDSVTIVGYAFGLVFAFVLLNNDPAKLPLLFYTGATAAFFSGLIAAIIIRDPKLTQNLSVSLRDNLSKAATNKSVLTLIPAWFVLMMTIGVFLTYTRDIVLVLFPNSNIPFLQPSSAGFTIGAGLTSIALVLAGAVLLGFTQTSFGSLSDKFGRSRIALIGEISIAGLLAILVGLLAFDLNHLIALAFAVLFGAGLLTFTPAALAELADSAPTTARGSAMGLYTLTIGAGTAFGPLLGGGLISHFGSHLGLAIFFSLGILIILVALVPRILKI